MSSVLITGGSSGIGEALVRGLRASGERVLFTFCRNQARAAHLAHATGAECVHYDLASSESVRALADMIRTSDLDAVVNNAAQPAPRQALVKVDSDAFLAYQVAALRGVLELTNAFVARARDRKVGGAVVNVLTSFTLALPPAKLSAYVTSKHALLGLTRSMAVEFVRYGVRVNAVSPSMTRTEFLADLPERFVEQVEAALPMERLATAAEVAQVIQFLLSPAASYIHGANIPITGGQAC